MQAIHDMAVQHGAVCNHEAPGPDDEYGKAVRFDPPALTYIKALRLPHNEQWLRDVAAVKAVGPDDIRGYLALWGDPERVDLEREFFTAKTDFWDTTLSLPRPLTWDHALDPKLKSSPLVGQIHEFGDDEVGRWYVAQLDRAHRFRKAIDKLISQRVLGTSSDSAPQYVIRQPVKSGAVWLAQWPLFAAALTTTPCEPRMLEAGSPRWKALGVEIPDPPEGGSAAPEGAPGVEIPADLLTIGMSIKRKAGVL
jgi:hypothetical protein